MWLTRSAHFGSGVVFRVSRTANSVGVCCVAIIMLATVVDVILRYFFNRPIFGVYEVTEYMMIIVVYLGLAYTQIKKAHITVDLFSRIPQRVKAGMDSLYYLVGLGMLCLIIIQSLKLLKIHLAASKASEVLNIPTTPFESILIIGCVIFCATLVVDFVRSVRKAANR